MLFFAPLRQRPHPKPPRPSLPSQNPEEWHSRDDITVALYVEQAVSAQQAFSDRVIALKLKQEQKKKTQDKTRDNNNNNKNKNKNNNNNNNNNNKNTTNNKTQDKTRDNNNNNNKSLLALQFKKS